MNAPHPGHVPTAGQQVAEQIRRNIVLGHLKDGDHLPPETQLLEQFAVSRPVLREALRILQSDALLSIRRGRRGGARVNAPTPEVAARHAGYLLQHQRATLADVFAARQLIEPPAVGLLTNRADPEALAQLRDCLAEEESSTAGSEHAGFHVLVVELSGSRTLALFSKMIADITTAHTQDVLAAVDEGDRRIGARRAHAAHRRLLDLVAAGDAAGAEHHWETHLREIAEPMLRGSAARPIIDVMASRDTPPTTP